MGVVLQGSLQHFAAKELLGFLGGSHDGTLDAESGGQRLRIALRGGQIVAAEGDADAAGVMAKLIGWSEGTFTFLDDVVIPDGVPPVARGIADVVAEAETRIAEARRAGQLYPDDGARFRVVNRPPGEINLTAEEFQVLFQIGVGKSLAQLRAESGRADADLYPILKRLQLTGLIEPVADLEATTLVPKGEPAPLSSATLSQPVPEAVSQTPEPPSDDSDLVATLTADDGTMHPLLEELLTIGRTPANAIALRDASVSASHARVIRTVEGFLLEDVGSRNGTFVNSERLTGKRLLADGDLIRLGKIILTFNVASDLQRKQSTEREMMA